MPTCIECSVLPPADRAARGGNRRGGGVAGAGDRVVSTIGSPEHLELEQAGTPCLGLGVVIAVGRCRFQPRLGSSLAPAGETEVAVAGCGPARRQRRLRAVDAADRDAATATGPLAGGGAHRPNSEVRPRATAIFRTSSTWSASTKLIPVPRRPARPVRPTRCT